MSNSRQRKVALAGLVEDMQFYPRHRVDETHVSALANAIKSGSELPPVVADKASLRIVDGWHRVRAYKRVLGADGSVPVLLVEYDSDADMMRDAVARNSQHGRRLDEMDRTRSVIMLRNCGLSDDDIASTIHVPTSRVQKIALKVASCKTPTAATIPGTQTIALKRSVSHMKGGSVNAQQAKAHQRAPGTGYLLIVQQLCDAIQFELLDLSNERLVGELDRLRDLLNGTTPK